MIIVAMGLRPDDDNGSKFYGLTMILVAMGLRPDNDNGSNGYTAW